MIYILKDTRLFKVRYTDSLAYETIINANGRFQLKSFFLKSLMAFVYDYPDSAANSSFMFNLLLPCLLTLTSDQFYSHCFFHLWFPSQMLNCKELFPIPEYIFLMFFIAPYLRHFLLLQTGRKLHQCQCSEVWEQGGWKRQSLAVFKLSYRSRLCRVFELYFLEE